MYILYVEYTPSHSFVSVNMAHLKIISSFIFMQGLSCLHSLFKNVPISGFVLEYCFWGEVI